MRKAQQTPQAITECQTAEVVQHHHEDDDEATCHEFVSVMSHDDAHHTRNHQSGEGRQISHRMLGEGRQILLNEETRHDGRNHHIDNREQHAPCIHIDEGASHQPCEEGRHQRSQQGGSGSHAYRQRQVALRQIGDDIRCRATRTAPHQNHTQCQVGRQPERLREQPCHQWHDGELCQTTNQHILRTAEHHLEVADIQCQAHPEHDESQHRVNQPRVNLAERFRQQERHHCHHQHQHTHPSGNKITYLFHLIFQI